MKWWHAVMARGPNGEEELQSFQGQPVVFDLEDPEDKRILGDMGNRGLVRIGCDLVTIGVDIYLEMQGEGLRTADPEQRTEAFEQERLRLRKERLEQAKAWLAGDQRLPEWSALISDSAKTAGVGHLFQLQGIPVVFSATNPRDVEEIRRITVRRPEYRPVRWGQLTVALPAQEWSEMLQEGAKAWKR